MRDKSTTKTVSGPLNMARLEGEIDGIHKVVYLLMDFHVSIDKQTNCYDIRAPTLRQFLIDRFDNTKHHLDFMIETYPRTMLSPHIIHSLKYIWDIQELAKRAFSIDKKGTSVMGSTEFPNVRLHYIDIRDEFMGLSLVYEMQHDINSILNNIVSPYPKIRKVMQDLKMSLKWVNNIVKILTTNVTTDSKISVPTITGDLKHLQYTKKEINSISTRIVNKIRTKYTHAYVKSGIHQLIKMLLLPIVDDIHKIANNIQRLLRTIASTNVPFNELSLSDNRVKYGNNAQTLLTENSSLVGLMMNYFDALTRIGIILMDAYALRRVLDKDYVTHGILYTGISHSTIYIWALVNIFNFKLTHIADHNSKSLTSLIDHIHKLKPQLLELLIFPKILFQCIDYTHFPELFT